MTTGIKYGLDRPQPLPADFIFTNQYVERTVVVDKRDGLFVVLGAGMFGAASAGYSATPAYFVFVVTPHGDLRVTISKKVFDLLQIGDSIVVQYQRGRWTGALKGKIAR